VNEKVLQCIYEAIDEANLSRDGSPPIEKSLETPIQGAEGGLDSLGLINFVVAVEEAVERELGVAIVLGDDRALDQDPSPFESVRALAAYTETLIDEQR
jgi:acyl carrier protein